MSLPASLTKRIKEMAREAHTKWIMFLNPENGNSDCPDTPSEVFLEAYTDGATDIAKELLAEQQNKICKVELNCEGGIWHCQKLDLESQLSATQELLREAEKALEYAQRYICQRSYNCMPCPDGVLGKSHGVECMNARETLTRIRSLHLNPSSKEEQGGGE